MPRRAGHNDLADSFAHIPINDRECVRLGLAHYSTSKGTRLRYDWASIRELWLVDPSVTLTEFAIKYHIPLTILIRDGKLSLAQKKKMVGIIRNGFTLQMIRKVVVRADMDYQGAAERIVRVLDNLAVFSESAAIFARVRMMKLDPQGNEMVNIDSKSKDVGYYSTIAKNVSETLKNVFEIRAKFGLDNPKDKHTIDEIVIEPPKSMGRKKVTPITPAGAAPAGTSGNEQAHPTPTPHQQASPTQAGPA